MPRDRLVTRRRRAHLGWLTICWALLLSAGTCEKKNDKLPDDAGTMGSSLTTLVGTWRYRSFYNDDTTLVTTATDPSAAALNLLWAEGTITIEAGDDDDLVGTMVFPTGLALDLAITVHARGGDGDGAERINVVGTGIDSTYTEGWIYELRGWVVPKWNLSTSGEPQTIVGSVANTV